MRKRKEVNEQEATNIQKKVKTDETNKVANRETFYKFFRIPSQVGYLPENIALSQKNKWTIKDYFNAIEVNEQSSSSHDNPEGRIPRGDNPGSAHYPAHKDNLGPSNYPVSSRSINPGGPIPHMDNPDGGGG
eukprot:16432525-Heterocapsa_arctica.AAC.1